MYTGVPSALTWVLSSVISSPGIVYSAPRFRRPAHGTPDAPAHESDARVLRLKRGEDRRLVAGHLWVFSNEVDTDSTPLTGFAPGAVARAAIGAGCLHGLRVRQSARADLRPHPLARVGASGRPCAAGAAPRRGAGAARAARTARLLPLGVRRVRPAAGTGARSLRRRRGRADRHRRHGGAQGRRRGRGAHGRRTRAALFWKNDSGARELEHLPQVAEAAFGEVPDEVEVLESGCVPRRRSPGGRRPAGSTIRRANRAAAGALPAGRCARAGCLQLRRRLGGHRAATMGRRRRSCVDSSEAALDVAQRNARPTAWPSRRRRTMPSMRSKAAARAAARASTWWSSIRRPSSSARRISRRARPPIASSTSSRWG